MTQFFAKKGNSRELVRTIRRHEVGAPKKATLEEIRPFLHTHANVIKYNEIHHVMQQFNDGNGIYIRGAGAGNIIRRNYIHDLLAPTVMQSSIRTDGGQRDTLITENLVYRCVAQGMQIKLNNKAINNIIADIRPAPTRVRSALPCFSNSMKGHSPEEPTCATFSSTLARKSSSIRKQGTSAPLWEHLPKMPTPTTTSTSVPATPPSEKLFWRRSKEQGWTRTALPKTHSSLTPQTVIFGPR
ncbi:right-handed parallel beta-helix repeat-containing protein [Akkermansiaceae bacterium]|nr:right-handed parallel beta-helix repeat-containing protein [Akkermansiaceae bacterium]